MKKNTNLVIFLREIVIHTNEGNNNRPCCSFLENIYQYSKWIGYKEKTAYIFLLRDMLLPYLFFKSKSFKNIFPWLIGLKFLEDITKIKNFDDDIRLPIYEALELGHVEPQKSFSLL